MLEAAGLACVSIALDVAVSCGYRSLHTQAKRAHPFNTTNNNGSYFIYALFFLRNELAALGRAVSFCSLLPMGAT